MIIFIVIILVTTLNFMFRDIENSMQANAAKILAAIDDDNDKLIAGPSVAPGCNFTVFLPSGEICFDNTGWRNLDHEPAEFDKIAEMTVDGEDLLVLDKQIMNDDEVIGYLRVISSTDSVENAMNNIRLLAIIIIPVYIFIAVTGSLFIAKTALKPIDRVTQTAKRIAGLEITGLDLSQRIDAPRTDDEVGRLAEAFNQMIANLESTFLRERQFSSDASHELRTPLSVISARTEEALPGEKTVSEYKETLENIASESKKMNRIITQLLTLTRGYDNRLAINKETFDLAAIIKSIVSEMKGFAEGCGVTIHYEQEEGIPIHADHMLITQMLINLISNACKYGKAGGLVTLTTEILNDDIAIIVEDNGIGISEEDLNHIFERFFKADKSHSGDGSGLGLSIVKWIVEAHSGSIEVKSRLNEGTSVKIIIPDNI